MSEVDRLLAEIVKLQKWHADASERADALYRELVELLGPCNYAGCPQCDRQRRKAGQRHLVGKPCDICNGTGASYVGTTCRHRQPA